MRLVVAVLGRDAGKQVLELLARHQIPVGQGRPPKVSQQRVAGAVHPNLVATWHLNGIKHGGLLWQQQISNDPSPQADGFGTPHIWGSGPSNPLYRAFCGWIATTVQESRG